MKTIVIIGAGAAGLMSAATILENSGEVNFHIHLFEKNLTPGKKVIISGGGRCNVTTGITDKKELLSRYTRGSLFMKSAMGKFSPKKCREWFESHGVPLKCEDDLRVFPISDNGRDIVGVFEKIFIKYQDHITLHFGEGVSQVSKTDSQYTIQTAKGIYTSDTLVITTGGNAYSHTGSTGDGYAWARALGHTVTALGPSLSSFLTDDIGLHACSGLAFEDARITFSREGSSEQSLSGPLLLTHFGISGPLTFRVSSHLAFEQIDRDHPKDIYLAPIGEKGMEAWEVFLKNAFATHPKKTLTNILTQMLSRRFVEYFCTRYFSHLDDIFVGSIARAEREKISELLGNGIPLTLIDRRPGDEFVTAGGVSTDEIDPETMQSKIQKDLYFAGEILDVDGVTGGFSLQICWASGYSVGKNIIKKL